MSIPLPDLLREHRRKHWDRGLPTRSEKLATGLWAFVAKRPALYRKASSLAVRLMAMLSSRDRLRQLPFAAGWTASGDLPAPAKQTFMQAWKSKQGETL